MRQQSVHGRISSGMTSFLQPRQKVRYIPTRKSVANNIATNLQKLWPRILTNEDVPDNQEQHFWTEALTGKQTGRLLQMPDGQAKDTSMG